MVVLAELSAGRVSIQCDLCIPPVLTINHPDWLRRRGWSLRTADEDLDACPNCSVRIAPRQRRRRGDASPTEPDHGRLPNVVVVGATKAGTTSMHQYLALHPEVAVPAEKEMRFFTDPDLRDWIGAYQEQFPAGTRYRAESTPFYSKAPCFPGVADRMAELVPQARIIYLVRDPVDRLIAEYVEQVQWNATGRSLAEEVADPGDPGNALVASSRYATQLGEYLRHFDRGQVLVVDLADLAADVAATMGRVFAFLGLEPLTLTAEEYGRFNTRESKRALPGWLMTIRRGPLVRAARRLPSGPRQALSNLAWRRTGAVVERPELEPAAESALRAHLAPETARLRELTGQDFAAWSI